MSDNNIVNEFSNAYTEAFYAWNDFYPLAARDLKYFLNDQWDEKERQQLFEEGRNAWSFNLIRKNINMIDGYQRSHRLSSVIVPQQEEDQQGADDLSDLLMYVMSSADGYKYISDSFSGAIKTGWNLCSVYMDYRDDPVNGDIKFGREPYSGFITDPYFTRLDLEDCGYVIRRKYVTPEQAASMLPGMEEKVWDVYHQGWSRDDKFTWLPYQTQPNGEEYIAYNEYYVQGWESIPVLLDTNTGEYTEWEGPKDALKYLLETYPQLKKIEKQKKYVDCHIILNDVFFKTERNQYGLNEYPFVPFVGTFEPECDSYQLKLQSLTRCMIDPQRESNRRLSQMTDLVESQINSGWIADEESVINPRSLFQTGQGKVIWRDRSAKPGAIEKIQPGQIPPSMFQLQELYARGMSEILGVNDAAFGIPESGNESGVMMMLRQGSAITNLQGVFDNLRYAQKHLSKKVLKLLQTWTPEKVERILGRKPSEQFYNKDFIKYDISIQEGVLTDTQRQMHFRQLVDLKQLGAPVSGEMLAKAAPLQGKSSYLKELQQAEQQQAQSAQQQQALQMQVLQGQMENLKASSIEKLAGAAERRSRTQSDLALATERISESEQNRAQAALDRSKTMVEVSKLNDERLMQVWKFVNFLEAQEIGDREQISDKVGSQAATINQQIDQETNPTLERTFPQQENTLNQMIGKTNINQNPEV